MKPTIGISCGLWAQKEEWIHQEGRSFDHLKRDYYLCIEKHGGVPMLLPNVAEKATIPELLDRIDGLLLSGGDDIDPPLYGETNLYEKSIIHPTRDRLEIALALQARERRIPILGICRGIQVLNVAFGGTCWQDSSLRPGTNEHKSQVPFEPIMHNVKIARDSQLFILADEATTARVTSTHHQHLKLVADGFKVSAVADDGIIEGIESIDEQEYIFAVQWHPESEPDSKLTKAIFDDFMARCGKGARSKP